MINMEDMIQSVVAFSKVTTTYAAATTDALARLDSVPLNKKGIVYDSQFSVGGAITKVNLGYGYETPVGGATRVTRRIFINAPTNPGGGNIPIVGAIVPNFSDMFAYLPCSGIPSAWHTTPGFGYSNHFTRVPGITQTFPGGDLTMPIEYVMAVKWAVRPKSGISSWIIGTYTGDETGGNLVTDSSVTNYPSTLRGEIIIDPNNPGSPALSPPIITGVPVMPTQGFVGIFLL